MLLATSSEPNKELLPTGEAPAAERQRLDEAASRRRLLGFEPCFL